MGNSQDNAKPKPPYTPPPQLQIVTESYDKPLPKGDGNRKK